MVLAVVVLISSRCQDASEAYAAYMNDLVRLGRERNIRPDPEIDAFMKSLQLGCVYACSICCPETCDHVYLFDNDYDDAKDIYGKSMRCRLPYDQRGRLILESMLG